MEVGDALPSIDVTVELHEGRTVQLAEAKASSWEGGSVWPPALLLARYLDAQLVPGIELSRCKVLELGAGCGAVGLVAACLGAQAVWLTDLKVALPTLKANCRLNSVLACNVSVCELDWRDPSALEAGGLHGAGFDLVIASECIYDEDMAHPLLSTMHQASGPGTICILSGIIGGAALDAYRREAVHYFAEQRLLPPLREGDDHMPASRGVHVLSRRRDVTAARGAGASGIAKGVAEGYSRTVEGGRADEPPG